MVSQSFFREPLTDVVCILSLGVCGLALSMGDRSSLSRKRKALAESRMSDEEHLALLVCLCAPVTPLGAAGGCIAPRLEPGDSVLADNGEKKEPSLKFCKEGGLMAAERLSEEEHC